MEIRVHGALVEILGAGVLLRGPSGVGKSECALELVQRGHRLVADDVVRIRRVEPADASAEPDARAGGGGAAIGRAPDLIRHHMEIRGIGLLYIPELYGADAVRAEARIDLVCHLEPWRESADYERIGLDRRSVEVAGVSLPMLVLPVRPARSMATLVEVAVRDQLQRRRGVNAARRLDARLREQAERGGPHVSGGEG